jgi:hypothetical protein
LGWSIYFGDLKIDGCNEKKIGENLKTHLHYWKGGNLNIHGLLVCKERGESQSEMISILKLGIQPITNSKYDGTLELVLGEQP